MSRSNSRNPFESRTSVTRLKTFNACPSISRSPFLLTSSNVFFFLSLFFFTFFFFLSSHAERQPPVFLRRPIFGCANTVHCRGARALTSVSLSFFLSHLSDNSSNPFLLLSLSLSLSLEPPLEPPFSSSPDPARALLSDLNMQNDFFLRHRDSFPCLVHRAHIITGWQENTGQKTIDERQPGEVRARIRKKNTTSEKKAISQLDWLQGVHSIPQRGERGGAPPL